MLSEKQFEVLTCLEKEQKFLTQRELAQKTSMSIGSVNTVVGQLTEAGLLENGKMTEHGFSALEPYRVKRAIIIAAGFGSRMVPITLNTPKPLIRVNGTRIIDSLLSALYSAGIEDVILVRGYLAEQFDTLLSVYPNLKFVENPQYNEENNISSLLNVRHLLANAYVCEADLLLRNPALITKYQYQTNYLGVPVEKTDDWCFSVRNGRITKLSIGGKNCYHMFGISYWSEHDGERLAEHILNVYNMPGGKERFWDQVPLEYYNDEYNVVVRECSFSDIVEIDTFKELKQLDPAYNV